MRGHVVAATIAFGVAAIIGLGWLLIAANQRQQQLAFGGVVYAARCASCHGKNLEGQPDWQTPLPSGRLPAPPHDAGGHTWHHSDEELFTITKDGMASLVPGYESDMPVFANLLSDDEIWAVLAFIKNAWPERERTYQQDRGRVAR